MAHDWDPARYLTYADERGRPFLDLLARVGGDAPGEVVDLGCGPGNLTALLSRRWPDARVTGVDASPAMLAAAREAVPHARLVQADVRDWTADAPVDVLVSNATLQWVPRHLEQLARLVAQLAPGGRLALQVPGNHDEPSHTLRRDLAARAPYAAHLAGVPTPLAHDAATYWSALDDLGCTVDAWETTYLHVLRGPDPVLTWVSATGARPTLQALPDDLRQRFVAELRDALAQAYPPRPGPDGEPVVLLAFRRVFAVARVPGGAA